MDRRAKHDARRQVKANDCGPISACDNPSRREACGRSLQLFLETYFPRAFPRKWSADHVEVIEKTQVANRARRSVRRGNATRQWQKQIHQRPAIWAILMGSRKFVFIACADGRKARDAIKSIKTECEFNPLLFADFPEVCVPIRALQGRRRAEANSTSTEFQRRSSGRSRRFNFRMSRDRSHRARFSKRAASPAPHVRRSHCPTDKFVGRR